MERKENFVLKRKTYIQFNYIKIIFYAFSFLIILSSIYFTVPILNAIIIAFIISYLINPIVGYFERRQIDRIWVVIAIFIIIIVVFVLLIFLIKKYLPTPEEINQFKNKAIGNLTVIKDDLAGRYDFIEWDELFAGLVEKINSSFSLTNTLPKLVSGIMNVFSLIIVIPFAVFFFLLNGREIFRWMLSFVPNKYFEMSMITIREVDLIFGSFIRGTLVESFIVGVLTTLGWYFIGFPFYIALITGMIAGLANAVPYVGPWFGAVLGAAICVLDLIPAEHVSLFGIHPTFIGVFVVVGIVQLIDQFLKPAILGKSVNLHPIIVILGIIIGGNFFGMLGMLLAIPIMAIVKVIISTVYRQLKEFGFLKEHIFSIISNESVDKPGS